MTRRAFTLIEVLCVVAMTAVLLGTMVLVFGFVSVQASDAYSTTLLWTQLNNAADRIELTIREANSCSAQLSGAALQCSMPNAGVDINQDGQWDLYSPSGTDSNGLGKYTAGGYVWYYTSTAASGAYNVSGSLNPTLYRAVPSTSASPTAANIDATFSTYQSGPQQYSLVNSLSASVNSGAGTVTYTLTANAAIGEQSQSSAGQSNMTRTLTVTRTVAWRNGN